MPGLRVWPLLCEVSNTQQLAVASGSPHKGSGLWSLAAAFLCCRWKPDYSHSPGLVQRRPSECLQGCRCLQAVAQSQTCSAVIWVPCRLVGLGVGNSPSRPSLQDCSHLLQRLHKIGAAPSPEGLSQLMQLMEACYALTRTWRVRLPAQAGDYMLLAQCSCCPVMHPCRL